MIIKEIDGNTFNEFANNHTLKNFYQTYEYGELMSHSDFSSMYIGGFINETMVAGSLILYKTIGPSMKYGYAPRGFLVDYYDNEQLTKFTKGVKDFFFKKGFAFIKIFIVCFSFIVFIFNKRIKCWYIFFITTN